LTSVANSEAGHSALVNLSKLFWKFNAGGEWKNSASGYMYGLQGEWQLQPPDQLVLEPMRGKTTIYAASFRNGGIELVLKDQLGQFQIMSRCD